MKPLGKLNSDDFLPPRHPRYTETKRQAEPKNKTRTPAARRLFIQFYEEFKRVHGYPYSGSFYPDTMQLDKLLKYTGVDEELVSKMIKVLFTFYDGRWRGKPATVGHLVYDGSRMELIDYVKRKEM